jgi:hypothetical protein
VNRPRAIWPVAVAATLIVAGCGHGGGSTAPDAIMVTSADTACTVSRTELPAQVHELSDAINALAEPVSRVGAAVSSR